MTVPSAVNQPGDTPVVLVIDDDFTIRMMTKAALEPVGFKVIEADRYVTGFELYHAKAPDVILLDLIMPDGNGFSLCTDIRAQDTETPIIIMTGLDDIYSINQAYNLGATDFITKPINWTVLGHRVRYVLRAARTQAEVMRKTALLETANQRLGLLEKAKSELLMLMSHELYTPLNGILGFSELLVEELQNTSQLTYCKNIILSAQRLKKLADTALMITALQLEHYDAQFKMKSLALLLRMSVEKIQADTALKNLQMTLHCPPEIVVLADEQLLVNCFVAVLENAVYFSPRNGKIAVEATEHGDQVVLSISDEGPGFSAKALANLFQPFYTEEARLHSEGTGLGLASAWVIVQAHDAQIKALNRAERGAMIQFQFPLVS